MPPAGCFVSLRMPAAVRHVALGSGNLPHPQGRLLCDRYVSRRRGNEIEVESGRMLEFQAALTAVRFPLNDHIGSAEAQYMELGHQLGRGPDPAVLGGQTLRTVGSELISSKRFLRMDSVTSFIRSSVFSELNMGGVCPPGMPSVVHAGGKGGVSRTRHGHGRPSPASSSKDAALAGVIRWDKSGKQTVLTSGGVARSETGHSVPGEVASVPAGPDGRNQSRAEFIPPGNSAGIVNSRQRSVQPSGSSRVGRQDRTEKRGGCLQKPQGSVGIPVIEFALDIRSCR